MVFNKFGSDIFIITKPYSLNKFFSHLLAYDYGSIANGHETALVTNIPLSIDTLSDGKPLAFHSRIYIGFPNVFSNVKL